ncbi:MAG: ABC transporter ATP-binding protein [Planctomycetes bacterium]|nr:ABC transporter ATP-binding protein [Planctomycetota bacterium]MBI3835691.1 ABC transporter ATP-binding protein [Planctomycetota bacterium]
MTTPLPEFAVELMNVRKQYGRHVALRNLSLQVRTGELFAFLGPNGAGKTTTIKLIVGLLRPNAGEVRVCGHEIGVNGVSAKAQLAYVPDQPFLYEKLTGREFLHFVAEMYGLSNAERDRELKSLSTRLDLLEYYDQLTESYSHGMKQRVALAAALLHRPKVLVVDEPMVGLDPRTVRVVKDLFIEHTRAGGTVFMSTHTLDIAEALADRIGIIHRGELIAAGTLAELRSQARREQSLEDIFLALTETQNG